MGCRLSDFEIGEWSMSYRMDSHVVVTAPAKTRGGPPVLEGVVFKLDGKFLGFTGSVDAAVSSAIATLAERMGRLRK